MTTVAVRLPDELIEGIDSLVDQGAYSTRTDAIRRALTVLIAAHEQNAIDRAIVEGYTRMPETEEEISVARAATIALIEEEPW